LSLAQTRKHHQHQDVTTTIIITTTTATTTTIIIITITITTTTTIIIMIMLMLMIMIMIINIIMIIMIIIITLTCLPRAGSRSAALGGVARQLSPWGKFRIAYAHIRHALSSVPPSPSSFPHRRPCPTGVMISLQLWWMTEHRHGADEDDSIP
jgi:hypothetical protein